MTIHMVRARDKDPLAQFLGWFSVGLGAAQLAAPRAMCKVIGAKGDGAAPGLMRLMGVRELTQGVGILARPRPTMWLWSRVVGDAIDLTLLGMTAAKNDDGHKRTAFAAANVLAVAVPDVLESLFLSKKSGEPRSAQLITKAVTINRPQQDVEAAWVGETETRQKIEKAHATVAFSAAPGDQGTELAVSFQFDPPAGDLGAAAQKIAGRDLATQLADDLRRFKQRLETGQVVRSDSTPMGHSLVGHLKQRPAQPVEEARR
jgi:hypothetical protein